MNNEATTKSNYISNMTANSSSAMANELDFDYKFEKGLNEEVTNEVFKKVKFDRLNGFLSIMFIPNSVTEHSEESFIGVLEPGEAEKMREELKIFKKRFNDSFARKNKILFGH